MGKSKGAIFTNGEKVPFSTIEPASNYYIGPSVNNYADAETVEELKTEIKVLWRCIRFLMKDTKRSSNTFNSAGSDNNGNG